MPVQVQAPDGSLVEFPDGTPDDVMSNAMRKTFGGPSGPQAPDLSGSFNTALQPREESAFQTWAGQTGKAGDLRDYDLRGAWKSGAATSENGHLPDTFKKPNHPTFSRESQYNTPQNPGGEWVDLGGDKFRFSASPQNLKNFSKEDLQQYFRENEPNSLVTFPGKSGQHLTFEEGQRQLSAESGMGQLGAGMSGALEGVPIVGPALLGGAQRAAAGLSSLFGGGYDENLKEAQAVTEAAQTANPGTALAGNIAGGVGSMIPLGGTALGARALGITGPSLLSRVVASAGSGAAISGADTAARGGGAADVINNTMIGGALGGAIPAVGAGVNAALSGAGNAIAPRIASIVAPMREAQRRVGVAMSRDTAANPTGLLSNADEAVANQAGLPIVNADRGGETTRALARSAANQSPEARQTIENLASDRFGAQSQRAVDYLGKVMGGRVDDLAYQDAIKQTAAAVNRPAYKAAFEAPEAQSIFTPKLQELMQAPSFRSAVTKVPARSADRGAVQGFKELGNPFTVNSKGNYVLRQKADGTLVTPSLEFWNQVKINLDSSIGKAKRAGDNAKVSDLMGLKSTLVNELDNTVGTYKSARQGAATFFDAEDALDAGRKFASTPKALPEATKAVSQFSDAEKKAFSTGYASELIDRIKASGDRTNVINSVFKSQASREGLELALGPQKARQIEAYVRVEDIADRLRGSMGNSTTARQLVELGIGGGAGYFTTGDVYGALGGALAMKGARYVGEKADAKVMESVAKLLAENNPGALQTAVTLAAQKPAYMKALEKLGSTLAPASRIPATEPAIRGTSPQ